MGNDSFQSWMRSIASAAKHLCHDPEEIYYGVKGCKRLAKECGYTIPDFTLDRDEQNNLIRSTYACICMIAYDLKPPLDSKEWFKSIREGRDEVMRMREGKGVKNAG